MNEPRAEIQQSGVQRCRASRVDVRLLVMTARIVRGENGEWRAEPDVPKRGDLRLPYRLAEIDPYRRLRTEAQDGVWIPVPVRVELVGRDLSGHAPGRCKQLAAVQSLPVMRP